MSCLKQTCTEYVLQRTRQVLTLEIEGLAIMNGNTVLNLIK